MRFSPESQQFGNEQEKKEVVRVRVRAGKIEGWRESGREEGRRERQEDHSEFWASPIFLLKKKRKSLWLWEA